jgi:hypothetical protein
MKTFFLRRTKTLCQAWKQKFVSLGNSKFMEFKDDEEVDFQVDGLIPNLGCTRTKNSKLLCTMELY